jgi:hypothetical protein
LYITAHIINLKFPSNNKIEDKVDDNIQKDITKTNEFEPRKLET